MLITKKKKKNKREEGKYIYMRVTNWLYIIACALAHNFDFSKIHVGQLPKVDPLSRNRINERNARVYRPTVFNPSRLVFSCCFACFFFVQRFGIIRYLPSIITNVPVMSRVERHEMHRTTERSRAAHIHVVHTCAWIRYDGRERGEAWHILQP